MLISLPYILNLCLLHNIRKEKPDYLINGTYHIENKIDNHKHF